MDIERLKKNVGDRLAEWRKGKKITQAEAAKLLGNDSQAVYQAWEVGRRSMQYDALKRFYDAGGDLNALFGGVGGIDRGISADDYHNKACVEVMDVLTGLFYGSQKRPDRSELQTRCKECVARLIVFYSGESTGNRLDLIQQHSDALESLKKIFE